MSEPCAFCHDPESNCWGAEKADSAPLFTAQGLTPCPRRERELLARLKAIKTTDELRAGICDYCEPLHLTGGILHLTLEENAYSDEIIRRQLNWAREEGIDDEQGFVLGEKLLLFTEAEREHANRWETAP